MADYNGDGRTDLLSGSTCCNGTCFYLFRRKPDGAFGPLERIVLDFSEPEFTRWDLPINGLKSRVAVADWNGDGHPDLLVTGASAPAIAYGPFGGKDTVTVKVGTVDGDTKLVFESTEAAPPAAEPQPAIAGSESN